jgi:DNA polymerase-1
MNEFNPPAVVRAGEGCDIGLPVPRVSAGTDPKPPAGDFIVVRSGADLPIVLAAIDESGIIAADTETTGLDPGKARVRLLSLATGRGTYVVDLFAFPDVRPVLRSIAQRTVIFHNAPFDLRMLAPLGFEPRDVRDTMRLSQQLHGTRRGKGFHSLGEVVKRELGRELDKRLQKSDWGGELSAEQLTYAAADAAVLLPLYDALERSVRAGRSLNGQQHP